MNPLISNLVDDVLIIILRLVDVETLMTFVTSSRSLLEFFRKNIGQFSIDLLDKGIDDKGLKYLEGVQTIDLSCCVNITDKGIKYLKGVHTIDLNNCIRITDKGLKYLKGVHTIDLSRCNKITDEGLKYLKGVHIVDLTCCGNITAKGLEYLKGAHIFGIWFQPYSGSMSGTFCLPPNVLSSQSHNFINIKYNSLHNLSPITLCTY